MSGIYITGMEMPTSCFYCPFRRKVDPDDIMCIVTREVFEETFAGTIETRNRGNCPLVPVPDHGDLIDRVAFREEMDKHYPFDRYTQSKHEWEDAAKSAVIKMLATAPTIIPASGGTDNE